MEIKILGGGCSNCNILERLTKEAIIELELDANLTKVDNIMEIMKYNILRTPALLIDDKLIISGKLPAYEELKLLIKKNIEI